MRSSIIQRQVRNIINYGPQQDIKRQTQGQGSKNSDRVQSAKIGARNIRYSTDLIGQDSRLLNQTGVLNTSKNVNRSYNSYVESIREDSSKIASRSLVFDKEKLYQEQFQLKRQVHNLNDENLRQKTKIQQLEGSLLHYEKLIEEVDSLGPSKPQFLKYTTEAHLTNSLKKEIKSMRIVMNTKDEEVQKLKKHLKQTKLLELEIEKKGFSDETIRLKYLLDQTIQASIIYMTDNNVSQGVQDKLLQQTQQIYQLKLDKVEQDQVIQRLQKQCLLNRTHQIEVEGKMTKKIERLRIQQVEKQKDYDLLKSWSSSNKSRYDENSLKILTKENEYLKAQLNEKNKQLEENNDNKARAISPESQREIRNFFQTQIKDDSQEYISQHSESNKKNNKVPTQGQEKQLLMKGNYDSLQSHQTPIVKVTKSNNGAEQGRKLIPISYIEVKWIGETLKYRLRACKIDWIDIESYLFSKQMIEDCQSNLGEIRIHLQKFPFDLSFLNSNILARYLIEGDSECNFNDKSTQNNPIVKSVFKRLIGSYSVDDAQDGRMRIKLQDQLFKYKNSIFETIKGYRSLTITKQQLQDMFLVLSLELTSFEVDYIIVQGILDSASVNQLNYQEMFKFVTQYDPISNRISIEDISYMNLNQLDDKSITKQKSPPHIQDNQRLFLENQVNNIKIQKSQQPQVPQKYQIINNSEDTVKNVQQKQHEQPINEMSEVSEIHQEYLTEDLNENIKYSAGADQIEDIYDNELRNLKQQSSQITVKDQQDNLDDQSEQPNKQSSQIIPKDQEDIHENIYSRYSDQQSSRIIGEDHHAQFENDQSQYFNQQSLQKIGDDQQGKIIVEFQYGNDRTVQDNEIIQSDNLNHYEDSFQKPIYDQNSPISEGNSELILQDTNFFQNPNNRLAYKYDDEDKDKLEISRDDQIQESQVIQTYQIDDEKVEHLESFDDNDVFEIYEDSN